MKKVRGRGRLRVQPNYHFQRSEDKMEAAAEEHVHFEQQGDRKTGLG